MRGLTQPASLPACLPGGRRVNVSEREANGLLGIAAASLSFPGARWTYRELGKFAGPVFTDSWYYSFSPRGAGKEGSSTFKDGRTALTSGQGILSHRFLWQPAGPSPLGSFQVQGSRDQQPLLAFPIQEGRPGFCSGLPAEEPGLHGKGHVGLNVPYPQPVPLSVGFHADSAVKKSHPISPVFADSAHIGIYSERTGEEKHLCSATGADIAVRILPTPGTGGYGSLCKKKQEPIL